MSKKVSLKEQKKILEENIAKEQKMIDNNESYDNKEQNISYGPNHFKKAIEQDKKDLNEINTKLEAAKKIDSLKRIRNSLLNK